MMMMGGNQAPVMDLSQMEALEMQQLGQEPEVPAVAAPALSQQVPVPAQTLVLAECPN